MKLLPMLDGRYQVVKKLSAGGFGVTYLAKDTRRPGHPLCVAKELLSQHHNNPKVVQLFDKEAEILERLGRHDQIPKLLASFPDANRLYLIQEYIDGTTLADELHPSGGKKLRKTEPEVLSVLTDVLTVLAFVHKHQVVHRDIKPANLIRRREDGKTMLIDFGAVKELTSSQINEQGKITTTISIGTPGYSPPEQLSQGNPRPASDIYALGVTAIEALTGEYPTELETNPNTFELVWQERCQVSYGLAAFITQMVHPHFSRRFDNASEALAVLTGSMQKYPAEREWGEPALPSDWVTDSQFASNVSGNVANSSWDETFLPPPLTFSNPSLASTVVSDSIPTKQARARRDLLKLIGFSAAGALVVAAQQFLWNAKDIQTQDIQPLEVQESYVPDPDAADPCAAE